jgi:hypothetical protein
MKNKKSVFLLVALIVLSGFGREFIMKNINWVVKYLTQGGGYWAQEMFDPLLGWSLDELSSLKWVLTICFSLYFYGLTLTIVRLRFPKNKYLSRITTVTFLSLILISFILIMIGWLANSLDMLYPIARNLMGVVQSFLPLMILFLTFKFLPQKKA